MKRVFWILWGIAFSLRGQECYKAQQSIVPLANLARYIDLKFLKLQIEPSMDSLFFRKAVATWRFSIDSVLPVKFYLHDQLWIDSVVFQNQALAYSHQQHVVEIAPFFTTAGEYELSIYYHGVPASEGFGSVRLQPDTCLWTLSEPYGAFTWFPNKEDLLDKIDSVEIEVTVPNSFFAVANGELIQTISSSSSTLYHWKHRFPIAHYLVAFAVARYVVQDTIFHWNGKDFRLVNYVYVQDTSSARANTQQVVAFLPFLFEKFGEYPFYPEAYGQAQFGWGGGMEHQTVSFVGGWWIELLIHELAHQWFGDLVTCATWQDLWLNEGFATYVSGLFYENIAPQWWKVFLSQRMARTVSEPLGAVYVPAQDTADVSTLFSSRLRYHKAAMVLHQLRFILGDTAFYQACYDYLHDPVLRFRQAYTQDLKRHFQNHTSFDLNTYFQQWIYSEGYPNLYLHHSLQNHLLALQLEQLSSNPNISWFHIPIPIRIYGQYQQSPFVLDTALYFTGPNEVHYIPNVERVDSILIDPDLWIIKGDAQLVHQERPYEVRTLQVYPNPTRNAVQLNLTSPERVVIYDLLGNILWEGTYAPGQKLDFQSHPPGVYWIKVKNEVVKLVKI